MFAGGQIIFIALVTLPLVCAALLFAFEIYLAWNMDERAEHIHGAPLP